MVELYRMRRKDGTEVWVEDHGRYVCDSRGAILFHEGTLRDVSERKKADDQLREAEELYRSFIDATHDLVQNISQTGRILFVNPAWQRTFGYASEEVSTLHILDLADEASRYSLEKALRLIAMGHRTVSICAAFVAKNGSRILLDGKLVPRTTDGKWSSTHCFFQNITEQRKAEEATRESEERFRQIADSIRDVFWLTDVSKNIMYYVSPAYEEIWQRTCESLIHYPLSWVESIHPDDRERVLTAAKTEQKSGIYDIEYRIVRPNGGIRWIHDRAFPIRNQAGEVYRVAGVAEDVTERKRSEELFRQHEIQRRELEKQLIHAQKLESLGTLASGIAHDFNNILAIIMAHVSLLNRGGQDETRLLHGTQAIMKATARGASMVKQLLTFARKADTSAEPTDLNEVTGEVAKLVGGTFPKTITVKTELTDALPPVMADATQIHQVLLNLCVNARDAMPNGGILTISTSLHRFEVVRGMFANARPGNYIRMSVSDTGTGIDETTKERMFDPFFTTKDIGNGTGLGLALVHSIISNHEGFIDVDTECGRGTVFNLYLPADEGTDESSPDTMAEDDDLPGGDETILIIEDEPSLREVVGNLLSSKGYTVISARDGEDAIALFTENRNRIMAVVSDLGLPKRNGYEVFVSLIAMDPDVRIIFASGFVDPGMKTQLQKLGASVFIQKPYRSEELLQSLREILDTPR